MQGTTCSIGDVGSIPGSGGSLEEEMATHSSFLAWEIPWTEEPGGLQSMGSQESNTLKRLNHHHQNGCVYYQAALRHKFLALSLNHIDEDTGRNISLNGKCL